MEEFKYSWLSAYDAVNKGHISGDGEYTKKCAKKLEELSGTKRALLTTSCTHATEMVALLSDIKPGDEVIMPSYTFVSTADAFVLRERFLMNVRTMHICSTLKSVILKLVLN